MKKLWSILLSLCLLCGASTAFAAEGTDNMETAETVSETQAMADALNLLGLFRGTDLGYELDRALNRAEALTLVVRMVGAEEEALAGGYAHPYTDVPAWASPYVAYAHTMGITKGVSDTLFGAADPVTDSQFLTFILRVLGYQDANDGSGDFTWKTPYTLAANLGLVASGEANTGFVRGSAVEIMWAALQTPTKGQETTLADTLVERGAFTQEALTQAEAVVTPPPTEEPVEEPDNTDDTDDNNRPSRPSRPSDDDDEDDRPEPEPEPEPEPGTGGVGGDDEWGGDFEL